MAKRILAALVCFVFAVTHASIADAASPRKAKTPAKRNLTFENLNGYGIAAAFASVCSETSWKEFATWAKKKKFTQMRSDRPVSFELTGNGVKSSDGKLEVGIGKQGQMTATLNGKAYAAADPCELFLQITKPTRASALDLFLPFAHAENRVEESYTMDWLQMVGGGALAVGGFLWGLTPWGRASKVGLSLGKKALRLLGLGLWTWTGADIAYGGYNSMQMKTEFERILNGKFNLKCTKTDMLITFEDKKIYVRKTPPRWTVDLIGPTGIEVSDTQSEVAVRSREFVTELATECNSDEDVATMTKALNLAQEELKKQVAEASAENPGAPKDLNSAPAQVTN